MQMRRFHRTKQTLATLLAGIGLMTFFLPPAMGFEYKSEKILSKAAVFAKNGMVASAHPLASRVGVQILE